MLKIIKKQPICKEDVKCIDSAATVVGTDSKTIVNLETQESFSFDANVSALKLDGYTLFYALSNGELGVVNKGGVKIHSKKVTSLRLDPGRILTGSWDHSAILLEKSETKTDLSLGSCFYTVHQFPHPETVWAVEFLGANTFVTGCADSVIRLFNKGGCIKTITHHRSVIRGIVVTRGSIYSVDNYGVVMQFGLEGKLKKMRQLGEMCYSVFEYGDKMVVTGENGAVFVISRELEVIDRVTLDSPSIWCGTSCGTVSSVVGGNTSSLVVGGSTATTATDATDTATAGTDANTTTSSCVVGASNGAVYYLQDDGIMGPVVEHDPSVKTFISGDSTYKIQDGVIYIKTGDSWEMVGYEEKKPDHSFSIEFQGRDYTISFSDNDNVHEVATTFLSQNKLGLEHKDQIVNFINSNFKKQASYKMYETLDFNGVTKAIGPKAITAELEKIKNGELYSIFANNPNSVTALESKLFDDGIPLFVVLDICKYLIYKKISVDLSFLFRNEFQDKKEAKAFCYLLTNVLADPPFNTEMLHEKIRNLRDKGYLNDSDLVYYQNNYSARKSMK